jgi:hypothetical protein
MKWNELSNTLIITERKVNDINTIKSKMESQLLNLNARITKINNGLTFSRSKLYSQGTLMTKNESLGFMREGEIVINKESHSLKISWTVKLDSLYFFALCCSFVAGTVISLYANTELVISVSTGILFFLMFVFIGIVLIKVQLNDLINSSVYRNYY